MADIEVNVNHAARRAASYWEIDGLPSIVWALFLLLSGSLVLWMPDYDSFRKTLFVYGLSTLVLAAFAYFVAWVNSPAIRWLKARITFPRTGYMALPPTGSVAAIKLERERQRVLWIIFTASIFAPLFNNPWVPTILITLATSILWGRTKGRFPSAGIVISGFYLSAILLPFLPVAKARRVGYFCVVVGLVLLLAGIVQLADYLRRHPVSGHERAA